MEQSPSFTIQPISIDMNVPFNGGKMQHAALYVNSNYLDEFNGQKAQEALNSGEKELKVDGECSAIHREGGEWVFYRRQDCYKGKEPTLPLADGLQPSEYNENNKPHSYCWLRVDKNLVYGKGNKLSRPGPDTYSAIEKAVEAGHLPAATDPTAPEWITTEWVGSKHQCNMDGIPLEHALIPHLKPFVSPVSVNSLSEFHQLVHKECIEGVIIVHPDGTRFKLRSDMTGDGNLWSENKRKKAVDPGVTTIRPMVLTKDGLLRWTGKEWIPSPSIYCPIIQRSNASH